MLSRTTKRLRRVDLFAFGSVVFANVLLIINYYSGISIHDLEIYYFNADTLYLPSLYRDLFQFGNSIEGWTLNAAPNFFPDMGVYFLIMLFTDNFMLAAIIFSIIQYLIIAFSILGIAAVLFPRQKISVAVLSNCLFTPLLLIDNAGFVFQFLANSYHLGAFVNALLAWNLLLRLEQGKVRYWVLLFALIFVAAISDKLFHVLFTVPAMVSWTLVNLKGEKRGYFLVFWIGAASWLASIGYKGFQYVNGTVFARTPEMPQFENVPNSFEIFYAQMHSYISEHSLLSYFIITCLATLLIAAGVGLRELIATKRAQNQKRLWRFLIASSMVLAFLTPALVGSYVGWDSIRYNFAFFTLAPIALGFMLVPLLGPKGAWLSRSAAFALIPVSVFLLFKPNVNGRTMEQYLNYYPERVAKIDEKAHLFGSRYGIAEYWDAKVTTMFTKKGLRVYAAFPDLACYEHVANKHWFRRSMEDPDIPADFRFVIPNHHMPLESISSDIVTWGTVVCEDPVIVVTPPFKYVDWHRLPVMLED